MRTIRGFWSGIPRDLPGAFCAGEGRAHRCSFPVLRVCISRNPLRLCVLCSDGAVQNPPLPAPAEPPQPELSTLFIYSLPAGDSTSQPSLCSPNGCAGSRKQLLDREKQRWSHTAPITQGSSTCGVEPAVHLQACTPLKNIPARYASDFMAIKKFWDEFGGVFVRLDEGNTPEGVKTNLYQWILNSIKS